MKETMFGRSGAKNFFVVLYIIFNIYKVIDIIRLSLGLQFG